jgi:stage II sporulation protein D (peptidoglycan lytic transglycosylase)
VPRKTVASLLLFLITSSTAFAQKVQIGVLGLFHPRQITLRIANGEALLLGADNNVFVLEPGPGPSMARIRIAGDTLLLEIGDRVVRVAEIHVGGRDSGAATLVLGVPGTISRQYRGTLAVKAIAGVIVPMVTMDLETAVASVVAAESAPDAPVEALKAQAVVTRSYFIAGKGRHHDFDFCDLTHCQFLRDPPNPKSPAGVASSATRGIVITFQGKTVTAMFTRSCGGHTRTPAEVGMPSSGYPYFSVRCDYCYENPSRWTRRISEHEAERLLGKGEAGRLAVDRLLGWNAVPSNNFAARTEEGEVILEGVGQGHGVGFCQRGAKAMGEAGASFREIISHYFPNTTLTSLDPQGTL